MPGRGRPKNTWADVSPSVRGKKKNPSPDIRRRVSDWTDKKIAGDTNLSRGKEGGRGKKKNPSADISGRVSGEESVRLPGVVVAS
jgi:hypothetical protein